MDNNPQLDAQAYFKTFLDQLAKSFESKDVDAFIDLFLPNGWLRDILISDWDFVSIPKDGLEEFFKLKGLPAIIPNSINVDSARGPPVYVEQAKWVQGFFVFETPIANGEGIIRLMRDLSGAYKAFTLSLTMSSLKARPELSGPLRPNGVTHGPDRSPLNWLQDRQVQVEFAKENPQVVIVGGGQGGLILAARLKVLGIKTLVVEKSERLGDTWRNRYHSLVLHDAIHANHFPYLPFPANWPTFIPKDKIANWFESYASIMELNVWLNTTAESNGASYDDATGEWTIRLQNTKEGTTRVVKSHHLVQATGLSGEPNIPKFAGTSDFKGTIVHSSKHGGGQAWSGKKAIVVGCCNSGHDIAQDFYNNGADITMIQRSATLVVSSEHGLPILSPQYTEGGPPIDQADLGGVSFPLKAFYPYAAGMHKQINEADQDILNGLERAGFKISGQGGPGLLFKYFKDGGGYYIDVGCSSLIAAGKVKIKQGHEIARFEADGVRFDDDSFISADIVVLATGYSSMRDSCRRIFGSKIADQTGPVWGTDEQGEIQGVWRYSGHPGFWYMGGNFSLARMYSKYLALQIAAIEEGLAPKVLRPNH